MNRLRKAAARLTMTSLIILALTMVPSTGFAQADPPIIVGGGGAPQSSVAPSDSPITVGGGGVEGSALGDSPITVGGGGEWYFVIEVAISLIQ